MKSISKQISRKIATTILSISKHSRGRRCMTIEACERGLLSTYLSVSAHSQLQVGAISVNPSLHLHRSYTAFYLKQTLTAQLYLGQSQRRGVLKKKFKKIIQNLQAYARLVSIIQLGQSIHKAVSLLPMTMNFVWIIGT